ncbi:MAG: TatD family hydrolase [Dysgonamonadaceae bacterium]|jgi:TatD DNase family protein|nr:TatD family hydrolase [Dysgonamonadaceae bacterium]
MYYDLHTHHFLEGNGDICAIVSIGIHPWYIEEENIEKELDLIEKYATSSNIKAIGECGLDKLCETDFELQKKVFLSQISISEKVKKPLIIHCVKSFDEMVFFKKKSNPTQAWIIHGFRGKPQQAKQLIEQGFYLSFGLHYNEQSLQNIPIEKVFFETDDSDCDIRTIYKNAAKTLNISEKNLIRQIEENVNSCFASDRQL